MMISFFTNNTTCDYSLLLFFWRHGCVERSVDLFEFLLDPLGTKDRRFPL
jgi:hypothetical protein